MTRPAHIDPWSRPYLWFGRLGLIPTWVLPLVLPSMATGAASLGLSGAWSGSVRLQLVTPIAMTAATPIAGLAALYLPIWAIVTWVSPRDGRYALVGKLMLGALAAFALLLAAMFAQESIKGWRVARLVEERISTAATAGHDAIEGAALDRDDCASLDAVQLADRSWRASVRLRPAPIDSERVTLRLQLDPSGRVTSLDRWAPGAP